MTGINWVELGQLTQASGVNIGCNILSGDLPYAVSRVIHWGSLDFNALTGYDPLVYPHWYWYLTQTVAPTNLPQLRYLVQLLSRRHADQRFADQHSSYVCFAARFSPITGRCRSGATACSWLESCSPSAAHRNGTA